MLKRIGLYTLAALVLLGGMTIKPKHKVTSDGDPFPTCTPDGSGGLPKCPK